MQSGRSGGALRAGSALGKRARRRQRRDASQSPSSGAALHPGGPAAAARGRVRHGTPSVGLLCSAGGPGCPDVWTTSLHRSEREMTGVASIYLHDNVHEQFQTASISCSWAPFKHNLPDGKPDFCVFFNNLHDSGNPVKQPCYCHSHEGLSEV